MSVRKREKFIEPPGFVHVAQFDLPANVRAQLLDPFGIRELEAPAEVTPTEAPAEAQPDQPKAVRGRKSKED